MTTMVNLGPFYRIDEEALSELHASWAAGREPRDAGMPAFARDMSGVLSALAKGRQPEPVRGIQTARVVGLLASGGISPRPQGPAPDRPGAAAPRPLRRAEEGEPGGYAARGRELVMELAADPALWPEFLKSMAEHPGLSAPNLAYITEYRLERGLADTAELLSRRQVEALGGRVAEGARGVAVNRRLRVRDENGDWHDGGRFFREALFTPDDCEGLDPGRDRRLPEKFDPADAASMDRFVRATEGLRADIDALDPVSSYVLSLRYGQADAADAVPPAPQASSPAEVIAALRDISGRAGRVCARVDRELSRLRADVGVALDPHVPPAAPARLDSMTSAGLMASLAGADRARAASQAPGAGPGRPAN